MCCRRAVTFSQAVHEIAPIVLDQPPSYDSVIASAPRGTPLPSRRPSLVVAAESANPAPTVANYSGRFQECRHRDFECLDHVEDGYCLGTFVH